MGSWGKLNMRFYRILLYLEHARFGSGRPGVGRAAKQILYVRVSFQIDPDRPDDGNDQARVRVCRKLWIANGFFFLIANGSNTRLVHLLTD
jgi:hypothetical protein